MFPPPPPASVPPPLPQAHLPPALKVMPPNDDRVHEILGQIYSKIDASLEKYEACIGLGARALVWAQGALELVVSICTGLHRRSTLYCPQEELHSYMKIYDQRLTEKDREEIEYTEFLRETSSFLSAKWRQARYSMELSEAMMNVARDDRVMCSEFEQARALVRKLYGSDSADGSSPEGGGSEFKTPSIGECKPSSQGPSTSTPTLRRSLRIRGKARATTQ